MFVQFSEFIEVGAEEGKPLEYTWVDVDSSYFHHQDSPFTSLLRWSVASEFDEETKHKNLGAGLVDTRNNWLVALKIGEFLNASMPLPTS